MIAALESAHTCIMWKPEETIAVCGGISPKCIMGMIYVFRQYHNSESEDILALEKIINEALGTCDVIYPDIFFYRVSYALRHTIRFI